MLKFSAPEFLTDIAKIIQIKHMAPGLHPIRDKQGKKTGNDILIRYIFYCEIIYNLPHPISFVIIRTKDKYIAGIGLYEIRNEEQANKLKSLDVLELKDWNHNMIHYLSNFNLIPSNFTRVIGSNYVCKIHISTNHLTSELLLGGPVKDAAITQFWDELRDALSDVSLKSNLSEIKHISSYLR